MAFLSGLLMTKGRRQKAMRNKVENPAGFDENSKSGCSGQREEV